MKIICQTKLSISDGKIMEQELLKSLYAVLSGNKLYFNQVYSSHAALSGNDFAIKITAYTEDSKAIASFELKGEKINARFCYAEGNNDSYKIYCRSEDGELPDLIKMMIYYHFL